MTSFIIASSRAAGLSLEAFDLGGGEVERRDLDLQAVEQLHVLAYEASLSQLGLPGGGLTLDADGGQLPTPDRIHVLDGDPSEAGRFIELDLLPAALDAVRIAATNPCVRFEVQDAALLLDTPLIGVAFAVAADLDRVVVGLLDGRLYVVSSTRIDPMTSPLQGRGLRTGVSDSNGELWIGDVSGATVHGTLDGEFLPGPLVPLRSGEYMRFVTSPPSADFELYVATSSHAAFRFIDESWAEIHERSIGGIVERSRLQAGWLGPGQIGLIGGNADTILEITVDGAAMPRRLSLPLRPSTDSLHAMGWVEGVGSVVGTRYSSFYRRSPTDWELLPLPLTTPVVHALVDLGDGTFVAGGESNVLTQWIPARGQCAVLDASPLGGTPQVAARLGSGFVVVSDRGTESIAVTRFVRP